MNTYKENYIITCLSLNANGSSASPQHRVKCNLDKTFLICVKLNEGTVVTDNCNYRKKELEVRSKQLMQLLLQHFINSNLQWELNTKVSGSC